MSDEELLARLERECAEIKKTKAEAIRNQEFERAIELKKSELELTKQIREVSRRVHGEPPPPEPFDSSKETEIFFKSVDEMRRMLKRLTRLEKSIQDIREAVMILAERADRLEGKKQREQAL